MSNNTDHDVALGTAQKKTIDSMQKYYYGDVTLVGTFEPTVDDYDRRKPAPYGLDPLWQAWYGALRGESGNYYMPVRFLHVQMTPRLHLPCTPMGGPSHDCKEAVNSFYGYYTNEVKDGKWMLDSRGKSSKGFHMEAAPGGNALWEETNIMRLDFEHEGPMMQMYHPDPQSDWYYIASIHRVTGVINGDPVVGIGGLELAWSGGGAVDWRELAVPNRVEDIWIIYRNTFADGGFEAVTLYASGDGKGQGMLITEKGTRPLTDISCEVDVDKQYGAAKKVRWTSGGRTWEFTAENPASLTSPRNPSYIWMFGTCEELGVEREISESLVYAEILPHVIGLPDAH